MTTSTTEVQDRGVQGKVVNDGFRPQLFTVPTGTYAINGVFGAGTVAVSPAVTNIEAVTERDGQPPCNTVASIRKHEKDVDFELVVALDLTLVAPTVTSTNEVRIRTLQPLVAGNPGRYLNKLPPQDKSYFHQKVFEDVQIYNVDTTGATRPLRVAALPGANDIIKARLLQGGELALFHESTNASPHVETAVTWAELGTGFGATSQPFCRVIIVRGTYRSDAPVNSTF